MELLPGQIFSKEEFFDLLKKHLDIQDGQVLTIGIIDWTTLPDFVREFMQIWVHRIEQLLEYGDSNGQERFLEHFFRERGITYREFLSLYDEDIKQETYQLYDAYRWFGIVNEAQRRFFILDRTNDLEGYAKTLSGSSLRAWKFFSDTNAPLPVEAMKRHCYISGLSGSGKSELMKLIFYHLQEQTDHTLVLLDPHGDLAQEVLEFTFKEPERVVYIDPYLFENKFPVFNPFDIPQRDDYSIEIYTQQIVKVFQELLSGATLSLQMQALLTPCVATLLKRKGSSLYDLQRFMIDGHNEDLVRLGKASKNPSHRLFFEREFHNKLYQSTKLSIYTKVLSLLNTRTFFNMTVGESTIDLEAEINEGKIILFNLSKGKMGEEASEAFGRFVVSALQSIAQRRGAVEKEERKPTFLFIDEFQNYVTSSVEAILAETRKYGLHLVFANQFIDQVYAKSIRQAIKTNTDIKIMGRNEDDHFEQFADSLLVEKEDLLRLKPFEFYVKAGARPTYKMKSVHVFHDSSLKSTAQEKEDLLRQVEKYYREVDMQPIKPSTLKPKFNL